MKPRERAQNIVQRCQRAFTVGNPFPGDLTADIQRQIEEAVSNDWADTMRNRCLLPTHRALVDAMIAAMEAAADPDLDQDERIKRVRESLAPHVRK